MTHPDLLRVVRSCAKWRSGLLLVATLFGCTTAGAEPRTVAMRLLSAPGDTLRIGIAWGAATRATSYRLTVAATGTNGTWTNLPAALAVSATSQQFTAINAAWDSVTFTATVESVDQVGPTGKTATSSPLKLRRRAGAPGPITWDTSATIVGAIVRPLDPPAIAIGESRILCAFKVFASGAIARRSQDAAACDSIYIKYVPATNRLVSAMEQIHEDAQCWTWNTSNPVALRVTPLNSCSAAAMVEGLGLTWRRLSVPRDAVRLAGR